MAQPKFPSTLREFGYTFDDDGKLRKIDRATDSATKEPFDFSVSEDAKYNQKRYEALGEIINEYVYELLEKNSLHRLPLPKDDSVLPTMKSFIFASENMAETNKVIVIIHGSGVVRAGQWARRLIINDCLATGTQIPYIQKAKELGYSLFVLNTNDNSRLINHKLQKIKGSADPHEHLDTAWWEYIRQCKRKSVAIIAHSYGGECIVQFARKHADEFKERVVAVALTDSVHIAPSGGVGYISKIARNWACSDKPLDTPLPSLTGEIERVSAGHTVHEMSSSSSMESVFAFIEDRFAHNSEGAAN